METTCFQRPKIFAPRALLKIILESLPYRAKKKQAKQEDSWICISTREPRHRLLPNWKLAYYILYMRPRNAENFSSIRAHTADIELRTFSMIFNKGITVFHSFKRCDPLLGLRECMVKFTNPKKIISHTISRAWYWLFPPSRCVKNWNMKRTRHFYWPKTCFFFASDHIFRKNKPLKMTFLRRCSFNLVLLRKNSP